MSKKGSSAVDLMVNGVTIIQRLNEMGMEEKRKLKRESETVEQYEKRIREINENAIIVAVKSMIEE